MTDVLRQEIAALATTLVVKVGTQVLTRDDGQLDQARIDQLARQLHDVVNSGRKVVLVSSGAVGAGMGRLGMTQRPTDLPRLQAVAAIGQSLAGGGLRAGPFALWPPRRPGIADGRGPRTPHPLPQRPEYAPDPAGTGGHSHYQRKRYGFRGGVAYDLRRQRSAGGHRHQPDSGTAAWCCFPTSMAFATATLARPAARLFAPSSGWIARFTTSYAIKGVAGERAAWPASWKQPGFAPAPAKT